VEHAPQLSSPFRWRLATAVVGAIALIELVALIAIGAVRVLPVHKAAATPETRAKAAVPVRPVIHVPAPPSHPMKARALTRVLVLNGNGVAGAASSQATSLTTLGYTVAGAKNAPRHDYAQSMVMYVRGFLPEARRLARDIGVRIVAPVDGLSPSRLQGSKLVVLLGS
jgi:LytR cell envelope-related transcriptional attenuator